MNEREFFDLLDEVPRTPTSLLVQDRGELRSFPIAAAAKVFERRARERGTSRFPRLERARHQLRLLDYLLEKEDQL
jgi:hypothetical protein